MLLLPFMTRPFGSGWRRTCMTGMLPMGQLKPCRGDLQTQAQLSQTPAIHAFKPGASISAVHVHVPKYLCCRSHLSDCVEPAALPSSAHALYVLPCVLPR